ncbi:MAG: glycosyltransferase family 4 protein [Pyrinomonadaceae bacterium]
MEDLQSPPRLERRPLLRELNLHEESALLLNVGRISPQKGLLYAIRALSLIRKRFPQAHLLAVGATDDQAWLGHLRRVAETEGVAERVHFLGARSGIPDLLRTCDVFVFPSLHEGLGIALIEAMFVGCACVATTTGPIPEVIRDGENGCLVAPKDAAALAEAVCALLTIRTVANSWEKGRENRRAKNLIRTVPRSSLEYLRLSVAARPGRRP